MCVFFFKQKTAYEMRISDWSSDVCSSDLTGETLVCGARIIERKAAVDDRLHSRVFDEAQHRFGIGAAADLHGAYRQIVEQDRHQAATGIGEAGDQADDGDARMPGGGTQ